MTHNKSEAEILEAAERTAAEILAKWNAHPECDPTRRWKV